MTVNALISVSYRDEAKITDQEMSNTLLQFPHLRIYSWQGQLMLLVISLHEKNTFI